MARKKPHKGYEEEAEAAAEQIESEPEMAVSSQAKVSELLEEVAQEIDKDDYANHPKFHKFKKGI